MISEYWLDLVEDLLAVDFKEATAPAAVDQIAKLSIVLGRSSGSAIAPK